MLSNQISKNYKIKLINVKNLITPPSFPVSFDTDKWIYPRIHLCSSLIQHRLDSIPWLLVCYLLLDSKLDRKFHGWLDLLHVPQTRHRHLYLGWRWSSLGHWLRWFRPNLHQYRMCRWRSNSWKRTWVQNHCHRLHFLCYCLSECWIRNPLSLTYIHFHERYKCPYHQLG